MFPQTFLIQTAYEHELSPEQEEVLLIPKVTTLLKKPI